MKAPDMVLPPPRQIPGMERPLPDYSERLARRTGVNADLVASKLRGSADATHD